MPAGTYQVALNVGLANPENDATEFVCAVAFTSDDVTEYGRYDYLDVVPFGTDALADSTVDTFADSTDISLLCSTSKGDLASEAFIAHSSLIATPLGAAYRDADRLLSAVRPTSARRSGRGSGSSRAAPRRG